VNSNSSLETCCCNVAFTSCKEGRHRRRRALDRKNEAVFTQQFVAAAKNFELLMKNDHDRFFDDGDLNAFLNH